MYPLNEELFSNTSTCRVRHSFAGIPRRVLHRSGAFAPFRVHYARVISVYASRELFELKKLASSPELHLVYNFTNKTRMIYRLGIDVFRAESNPAKTPAPPMKIRLECYCGMRKLLRQSCKSLSSDLARHYPWVRIVPRLFTTHSSNY